jgi:protein-S-isoprenylcysteine O-methyltransferase Ste14
MSPGAAIVAAWLVWLVTWVLAAGWSARTASHHDLGAESPSRVLTLAALVMLIASYYPVGFAVLWMTPAPLAWVMFALVGRGLVALPGRRGCISGRLWSSTSAPTDDHRIVETGPYGNRAPPGVRRVVACSDCNRVGAWTHRGHRWRPCFDRGHLAACKA